MRYDQCLVADSLPGVLQTRSPARADSLSGVSQGTQRLRAFLADQRPILNGDALRERSAGALGTQCLKAFLADQRPILNGDALRERSAGTQGAQCLRAFLADQRASPIVDVL